MAKRGHLEIRYVSYCPDEFLAKTAGLSFEQDAVYRIILDLVVRCGDRLTDDDRTIATQTKIGTVRWRRFKAALLEKGLIEVAGSRLTAPEARVRIDKARVAVLQRQQAGISSGNSRKPLKNNPAHPAAVQRPFASRSRPEDEPLFDNSESPAPLEVFANPLVNKKPEPTTVPTAVPSNREVEDIYPPVVVDPPPRAPTREGPRTNDDGDRKRVAQALKPDAAAVREIVDDFMRLRSEIFGARCGMHGPILTQEAKAAEYVKGGVTPALAREVMTAAMKKLAADEKVAPHNIGFCHYQLERAAESLQRAQQTPFTVVNGGGGRGGQQRSANGTTPTAPSPDTDFLWRTRLESYQSDGVWVDSYGPPLGHPKCQVPKHLVDEFLAKTNSGRGNGHGPFDRAVPARAAE